MSSLRSKMIVLLTGITLITALVLTINSVQTFKKDKIAYIFENNSLIIQTAADKFRKEIGLATEVVRAHLAQYNQTGNINILPTPQLPEEYLVAGLELYQFDVSLGRYSRLQGLFKANLEYTPIPQQGSDVSAFFNPSEKQAVLFRRNKIILKDTIITDAKQFVLLF